jgi:pyruvate/2-oxoglutarate dehydrogenase complex dihydrolipoamide acyltransferase (E2) component
MKHPIQIPSLGLVEVVTVTGWPQQTVATVETEKSEVEIESPADGILEVTISAGPDLVSAEAVLGYVDDSA